MARAVLPYYLYSAGSKCLAATNTAQMGLPTVLCLLCAICYYAYFARRGKILLFFEIFVPCFVGYWYILYICLLAQIWHNNVFIAYLRPNNHIPIYMYTFSQTSYKQQICIF